jgi:hypothetical protein
MCFIDSMFLWYQTKVISFIIPCFLSRVALWIINRRRGGGESREVLFGIEPRSDTSRAGVLPKCSKHLEEMQPAFGSMATVFGGLSCGL